MGSRGFGRWVGVGLLASGPLWAQQGPEDALLRECFTLREQGRHDAAFERCSRAVTLVRSSRSLAQLAITEFALHRWTDAASHITEALADQANPLPERSRAVLTETMLEVRPHVSELRVEGGAEGASVMVNGQAMGTLPLAVPLFLAPGSVLLSVRPRQGAAITRRVTLTAGQTATETVRAEPAATAVAVAAPSAHPRAAARVAPPTAVTPPEPHAASGSTRRVLAWTAAGVAVAGFGLSLAAWRLREGAVSDYVGECPAGEVDDPAVVARCGGRRTQADADVDQWGAVATVGLVAGAALAVTSAVLFATSPSGRTEARAVRCGGGPGLVGVGCTVAF